MIDRKCNKIKMKLNSNNSQERHTHIHIQAHAHTSVRFNIQCILMLASFIYPNNCFHADYVSVAQGTLKHTNLWAPNPELLNFTLLGKKRRSPVSIFLSFWDGSANHFHISIWQSPDAISSFWASYRQLYFSFWFSKDYFIKKYIHSNQIWERK